MQWCVQKHPALAAMEQFIDKNDSDFTLARQPLRSTGRTAIHADVDVKEYPPEQDNGSQLEFSMEGVPSFRQHQLTEFSSPPTGVWQPKWNSGQGINKSLDLPGQNGICVYTTQTDSAEQAAVQTTNQDSTTKSPNDISVCPRHHIYADDELAVYSTSLQQLIPTAQVSLNAQQAASMGLSQGDTVQFKGKTSLQLPCSIESDIADGIVLVPLQHYLLLGAEAHVQLSKSEATHE
jgi:NADH-quinone oxidoreductase subunit G